MYSVIVVGTYFECLAMSTISTWLTYWYIRTKHVLKFSLLELYVVPLINCTFKRV